MRTREEQIKKITEVMKDYTLLHTYGDDGHGYPLIDALTPDGRTVEVGGSECGELAAELYDSVIAPHTLEAERRAEQRVRAEIGRDSERLDWLGCSLVSLVIMKARSKRHILNVKLSGPLPALSFRKAIDAAREVG